MIRKTTLLLSLLAMMWSCHRSEEFGDNLESGSYGEIAVSFASVTENPEEPIDPWGTMLGDFRLLIYSGDSLIKKWHKYSDLVGNGIVREGTHRVVTFYGDSLKVGFAKPYYYGETPVTIVPNQVTPVTVTAKLRNVEISVNPSDGFKSTYPDYEVLLYTSETRLFFDKDETRSAFAPPADIRFRITFTNTKGEKKIYIPPTITGVKPGEHIKLNLNTEGSEFSLNITKDTSTEDKELIFEIPLFMTPKPQPEYTSSGFVDNAITFTEGFSQNGKIGIYAPGVIRECILKVNSQTLAQRGWPAEFDLLMLDQATRQILERDSLKWDDMTDNYAGNIDLGATLGLLGEGVHTFSLKVTDGVGQTVESPVYTANTNGAQFEWLPLTGAAWGKHVETGAKITDANPEKFKTQIYVNGAWSDFDMIREQYGDTLFVSVWGRNPQTSYKIRGNYNDTRFTEEVTLPTEAIPQMPNSDFEIWSDSLCYEKKDWFIGGAKIYEIFPFDRNNRKEKFWDTRNALTTGDRNSYSTYYRQYSGTRSISGDSGLAAEISTVNWGSGSTFVAGGGHITQNITPGILFTGEYDVSGKVENYGRSFGSRPTGIKFDYKYQPMSGEKFDAYVVVENRDGDVVTELGRGHIDQELAGQIVSSFTNTTVKIKYTDRTKKATHITVVFLSSTAEKPAVAQIWGEAGAFNGYYDSKYIGSVLTVDNVQLVYDYIEEPQADVAE